MIVLFMVDDFCYCRKSDLKKTPHDRPWNNVNKPEAILCPVSDFFRQNVFPCAPHIFATMNASVLCLAFHDDDPWFHYEHKCTKHQIEVNAAEAHVAFGRSNTRSCTRCPTISEFGCRCKNPDTHTKITMCSWTMSTQVPLINDSEHIRNNWLVYHDGVITVFSRTKQQPKRMFDAIPRLLSDIYIETKHEVRVWCDDPIPSMIAMALCLRQLKARTVRINYDTPAEERIEIPACYYGADGQLLIEHPQPSDPAKPAVNDPLDALAEQIAVYRAMYDDCVRRRDEATERANKLTAIKDRLCAALAE